jgi:hypothetical protein
MNRIELKLNLDQLNVAPERYSLYGELNPDAIILFQNYDQWQVFYFDERGGRNNERIFKSETEACSYIYNLFLESKEIKSKYGLNG